MGTKRIAVNLKFEIEVETYKKIAYASVETGTKGDLVPFVKKLLTNITNEQLIEICTRKS